MPLIQLRREVLQVECRCMMKLKCAVYGACIKTPMSIYNSSSFALGDINQYFHDMLTKIMTVANSF